MALRANYHPEDTVTTSTVLVKSVKVTIGFPGATGVDYAYASAADATEQELEIVGVIPGMCELISCLLKCTTNCDLVLTTDIGWTGGSPEIIATAATCDDLNDMLFKKNNHGQVDSVSMNVQSVFVNSTPGANWDTMTSGKWELILAYINYSLIE